MQYTSSSCFTSSVDISDCTEICLETVMQLQIENTKLKHALERAYTSSNFGCYNRAGGEIRGNEFLLASCDRIASGELAMVCCDVKGMGAANQVFGEHRVNLKVRIALQAIKSSISGVYFVSQINSGDEFGFIVDSQMSSKLEKVIDVAFRLSGFEGVYTSCNLIKSTDYMTCANTLMQSIYAKKQKAVCIK